MTPLSLIDSCNTFSENLASPEGFYGEVVSNYAGLAFETGNHWTVDLLAIQPGETVLEVGFGSGLAIQKMLTDGRASHVVGIDNSPLVVEKAKTQFLRDIQTGKLTLLEADVCHLPDFGRKFDKITAINTSMYWPPAQLESIFRSLRHCLAPGGMLCISFQRRYDAFVRGERQAEIRGYGRLLQQAGFVEIHGKAQNIADTEAAIADGRFIGLALLGVNPAFSL